LFILATRVIMGPARTPEEVAAGAPESAYPAAPNGTQPDATRVDR
jgi:hypothetical protein